jgi:putative ABC transport system permease protein
MRTIRRALRTILRSPLRTGLLVVVLAVSIGLTVIMITVNEAFGARLDEIKAEVGSNITVRPAGSFGGGFIGRAPIGSAKAGSASEGNVLSITLAEEDMDQIWSIDHVASVSLRITVPYAGEGLESAIELPAGLTPEGAAAPEGGAARGPPVMMTGIDDPSTLATLGVDDAEIVAGRTLGDDEAEAEVAVIGETLATKNDLDVGDTFEMNGASFEVIGIFTSGPQFGDNSVFLPLKTAQRLFDREDEIDEAVVRADDVDHVEQVAGDIRDTLGEDTADVVTEATRFESISAPISDAKDSSQVGMIAALVASAVVILFSVGLVARQRIKEIGIFKAIGASNWHVTAQFGIETAVVSVVAALVGALATFPLAQTVADGLVSDPAAPAGPVGIAGPGPSAPFRGAAVQVQGAGGFLGDVDVAVSPEVFLYALGLAVALAILASVVPAWYVGRVKPAEVLRYE